jgi:hypothetical protein
MRIKGRQELHLAVPVARAARQNDGGNSIRRKVTEATAASGAVIFGPAKQDNGPTGNLSQRCHHLSSGYGDYSILSRSGHGDGFDWFQTW